MVDLLRKSWFSRLPLGIYSYTKTRCSSSQQYPINFTKWGCLSCPSSITSACTNYFIYNYYFSTTKQIFTKIIAILDLAVLLLNLFGIKWKNLVNLGNFILSIWTKSLSSFINIFLFTHLLYSLRLLNILFSTVFLIIYN